MVGVYLLVNLGLCLSTSGQHSGRLEEWNRTAECEPVVDVVHATSEFDTLYTVFMWVYPSVSIIDNMGPMTHEGGRPSGSMIDFARMAPVEWTDDVPPLQNRQFRLYSSGGADTFGGTGATVDSIAKRVSGAVRAVRPVSGKAGRAEKEKWVRALEAYGDTAAVLPTIYAQIVTEYGGDVRAYVDELFRSSVVTNKRRLRRFMRRPTVRDMQTDMGFQFAVSKLMFRLWEQQGRPADPVVDGTRLVVTRAELQETE